ncbi:MAG: acyl-CoA thioesterase [SAR324 cluster bacterium]|nr:acyl-CoA thioesterase [SAR324 cluster bacterium]
MKWNREDLKAWTKIPTRWMDDDIYGHVNNVVYYSYFDTAVNGNLIRATGQDIRSQDAIGIVVESGCTFHRELSFPQVIEAGLLVEKIGNSSVTYRVGLFIEDDSEPAASGHFVHVYVDRENRRPVPVPENIRQALRPIMLKG